MAPIPRWVEGMNWRTVSVVTGPPSDTTPSMRSTDTGHQSTSDTERRSMAGPKRNAPVVTQAARASRHAVRAVSREAPPGAAHRASTDIAKPPMASEACRYRGTMTRPVRLVRTSRRETSGVSVGTSAVSRVDSPGPAVGDAEPPQAISASRAAKALNKRRQRRLMPGFTATPGT